MAALRTEFPFTLPKGYVDADGSLHRHGTMRLSTARDEIEPLRSRDIDGPDDPYLTVLVLARVITELGSLPQISTDDVESLFAADLAFLQDLYGIINFGDPADVEALQASVLPDEPITEVEPIAEPDVDVVEDQTEAEPEPRPASKRRARASVEEVTRTAAS
jgi:hypothetical protein